MFSEGSSELEQALAINPADLIGKVHIGLCRLFEGRWREAIELSQTTAPHAHQTWAQYQLAHALIRKGNHAAAGQTIEAAGHEMGHDALFHSVHAVVAALEGKSDSARHEIEWTVRNRKAFGHYHHAQYDVACAYALMGDREAALDWLTDAAHNGFPCHPFFERDPLLESVRSQERFVGLMDQLRTECDGYRALWKDLRSAEKT
jgi:tetratricopeptide (TPR) repeat protein